MIRKFFRNWSKNKTRAQRHRALIIGVEIAVLIVAVMFVLRPQPAPEATTHIVPAQPVVQQAVQPIEPVEAVETQDDSPFEVKTTAPTVGSGSVIVLVHDNEVSLVNYGIHHRVSGFYKCEEGTITYRTEDGAAIKAVDFPQLDGEQAWRIPVDRLYMVLAHDKFEIRMTGGTMFTLNQICEGDEAPASNTASDANSNNDTSVDWRSGVDGMTYNQDRHSDYNWNYQKGYWVSDPDGD